MLFDLYDDLKITVLKVTVMAMKDHGNAFVPLSCPCFNKRRDF